MTSNRSTPLSGGLRLKQLRLQSGKTQLEIELEASLGIGYLQRLERGKVKHPERDTLERILNALHAPYQIRQDIYHDYNYTADAPLPTAEEITWAIDLCHPVIQSVNFPAYLLDCAHRLLAWNPYFERIFPLESPTNNNAPLMPRILFDPYHSPIGKIANPEEFLSAQIAVFQFEMQNYRDETWHDPIVDHMLTCDTFAHYWAKHPPARSPISHRPLIPAQFQLPDQQIIQFRFVAEHFSNDRRFRVIYAIPIDTPTLKICATWAQS